MKNQQNQSIRAYALQVVLSLALLFGFAILFASLNAAAPAAADRAQPTVVAQPGFYPPLPFAPEGVPSCTPIEITDSIGTGLPKQTGRITPTGDQSACGAPNSCSTTPGMFQYKAYTFTNTTGAERCLTATLATPCGAGGGESHALFAAAYLGSFDPANPCTNLIGDTGIVSSGFNIPFGFNVPAGATFVIVVSETVEDQGCFAYKVHLEGLCGGQPTPTATATSTPTSTPTATPKTTPTPTPTPTPSGPCPHTIGFWKNHPDRWAVTSLNLGGTVYNQAQLLAILNNPSVGDASLILAKQLIATLLSIASGSDPSPVAATVAHAQTLLTGCAIPCGVNTSSPLGQQMVADATILNSYNNGNLTSGCGAL
jgi:hypothetical protein